MKPEVLPELRPLIERGEAAYERFYVGTLKDTLERTSRGKYIAINIDSGEYLLANTDEEVMTQFRTRFGDAIAYTFRIGMPRLIA